MKTRRLIDKARLILSLPKYLYRRFSPAGLPPKLQLLLTNRCNSRCKNCFIWKKYIDDPEGLRDEVRLEDYERLFRDYGGSLEWLAVSGGEPTLRPDFIDIIRAAKKHNPGISLVTINSNALTPEKLISQAREISEFVPNLKIVLSLDGDKETHDDIRGVPGNYDRVVQVYRALRESDIEVELECTVHDGNSSKAADYIRNHEFGKKTGVISFSLFSSMYYSNDTRTKEQKEAAYVQIGAAMKDVEKAYVPKSLEFIVEKIFLRLAQHYLKNRQTPIPCGAGTNVITIDPYGNVSPCFLMLGAANIKTDSIKKILSGKKFSEAAKNAKNLNCAKCWTNCYALTSIFTYPDKAIVQYFKTPAK
ncbi:MAG TPA: radical SAM protein [Candidatus Bilamarchaeum sp.]|nr:radical SAM protein [Candidatus Bilamarchaeum sp.]